MIAVAGISRALRSPDPAAEKRGPASAGARFSRLDCQESLAWRWNDAGRATARRWDDASCSERFCIVAQPIDRDPFTLRCRATLSIQAPRPCVVRAPDSLRVAFADQVQSAGRVSGASAFPVTFESRRMVEMPVDDHDERKFGSDFRPLIASHPTGVRHRIVGERMDRLPSTMRSPDFEAP
jgi:hypothetical protein